MFLRKETNGYWYVWHTNPKTNKRTKISTKTKNSVSANVFFTKFKKEYDSLANGSINSVLIPEFTDVLKNYKKNFVSSSTLGYYELELKQFDTFFNCNLKTNEIKQKHIDDYLNNLFKKNYSLTSIKRKMVALLICLKFAKKLKFISKENELIAPSVKVPQVEKRFLNEDELIKLLKSCDDKDLRDTILVAFMTGMRRGEIINLKWNQVDLDEGYIYLNNVNSLTKSRKIRGVPMTLSALRSLKKRIQNKNDSEYVFTFKSKKWSQNIQYEFNKLVKKTFGENSKITLHTLRHSCASNLIKKGVEIFTVSKLLGHSSVAVTQIYSHLANDTLQDAIQAIDIKDDIDEDIE